MHKRKDYYHAGGDNGEKNVYWSFSYLEPIALTNVKHEPEPYQSQPPDNKPSLFKRIATYWKGRTEAQKGQ